MGGGYQSLTINSDDNDDDNDDSTNINNNSVVEKADLKKSLIKMAIEISEENSMEKKVYQTPGGKKNQPLIRGEPLPKEHCDLIIGLMKNMDITKMPPKKKK